MIVLIGLAGGLGAATRFIADGEIRRRWSTTFPWATATINVSGSLLLGFLAGVVLFHRAPEDLQLIAGVGFCGGYTTFSTAMVETVRLAQLGRLRHALANALLPLTVSALAAGVGLALAFLG